MGEIKEDIDLGAAKKKSKLASVEEVKDLKDSINEPGVDKILEVGESPSLLPMEERTGGDDFLKQQPVEQPVAQQEIANPSLGHSNTHSIPANPVNINSPKEFTIQNPEDAIIAKKKLLQETQQQEVQKEISKESGNMLGDMLVDGFGMIAPEAANSYYSINEVKIKSLEKENRVPAGTLDEVKKWNKDHKNMVKLSKEQREFIHTPLVKMLEIHAVKADPTTMLIIGLCIVCFMMFMAARSIKKDGDEMVENLIDRYEKTIIAQREADRKSKEVPEAQVEEAFPNNQ